MKLSKNRQFYINHIGYKLPLRAKPLEIPREYYSEVDKVSFMGTWVLQVLVKSDYLANEQIKKQGFQQSGWGGGSSGLSDKELKKLNEIFQFKSMGYAEYEKGNLGQSFKYLKKNFDHLVSQEIIIQGKKFYTLCLAYHAELMAPTLNALTSNNQFPLRLSKQDIYLHRVVQNEDKNFIGAWNLDSHYLFFTNRTRFLKFKKLLAEK